MKVGLVIYGSLDTLSGGYLYDRKLVEALRRQGDDVEVVSLSPSGYLNHLRQNLQPYLLEKLRSLEVDVLLEDELNHPSLFWANRIIRSQVSYPILSIVHHLRSSEKRSRAVNWFYRWIERRYLASVDGFIWNSQTTRRVVEDLIHQKATGLVAYPAGNRLGGLAEEEITRRCRQPGPLRLLYIGNLIPRKGLHTLILALAHIKSDNWRLNVVGRRDVDLAYNRRVMRMVNENNLGERIRFLGNLSEAELAAQLSHGQALVMVSSYEGFGIVYLEGMSFGLPAIASTAGGAGEIIQNGASGWLVDADDVTGLAEAIRKYMDSKQTLLAHSQQAYRRFSQFPAWDDTTHQIRSFLCGFVETQWKRKL